MHDSSLALLEAATNVDPNPTKDLGTVAVLGGSALIADAGPVGTFADVASTTAAGQISRYIVRQGDSLKDIAGMFGVSVNTIVWANNLGASRAIHVGQTLVILPVSGVEHTVIKGETLAGIARKFGGDAEDIADYNGVSDTEPLVAGTTLIIPNGELAVAPAPAKPVIKPAGKNPFRGGSGSEVDGYYINPVPGANLSQGVHGLNGVDLAAPRGTPIHAAAAGTVIISRNNGAWNGGYGNYVVLAHPNGTQTLYSHMSSDIVSVGQDVGQGQVIGYVGRTGKATGTHLHYEVRGARQPFADCKVGTVCNPK